jgi:hypothetical protein
MAISNAVFSVTSTAQQIASVPGGAGRANRTGQVILSGAGAICHVGGAGVTTANGTSIAATSGVLTVNLNPGDNLFIVAGGATTIRVLRTGAAVA